jgi:hypothetical protein
MNTIKYGVAVAAVVLSTAAFAASDGVSTGNGAGAAANQPGSASEQSDAIPSKVQEGRAAKTSPTTVPKMHLPGWAGPPTAQGRQQLQTRKAIDGILA